MCILHSKCVPLNEDAFCSAREMITATLLSSCSRKYKKFYPRLCGTNETSYNPTLYFQHGKCTEATNILSKSE